MITKLPAEQGVIGLKEIKKGIEDGKITTVVFANNCPDRLKNKIKGIKDRKFKIEEFNGDGARLGTAIGKPFPVAAVGFKR